MPASHVIQLRGPWHLASHDAEDHLLDDLCVNIRQTDNWAIITQWLKRPGVQTLRLSRQFNWPAGATGRVHLEINGPAPARLQLNDKTLSFRSSDGRIIAVISDPQPAGNRLVICYDQASFSAESPALTGICLKISDA